MRTYALYGNFIIPECCSCIVSFLLLVSISGKNEDYPHFMDGGSEISERTHRKGQTYLSKASMFYVEASNAGVLHSYGHGSQFINIGGLFKALCVCRSKVVRNNSTVIGLCVKGRFDLVYHIPFKR